MCFQKWHEKFGNFSPEHYVSKWELWWHLFVKSGKCMSLKFTGKLCVITRKNDKKSEEELTCHFKIDIRNLTKFDSSKWVSKSYSLMGCFWPNYIMLELKKYRGVIFHDTRQWCKISRKMTCGLENGMRNLAKFYQNTRKSRD